MEFTTTFSSLVRMRKPDSSDLGAVVPLNEVTLTFAHTKPACLPVRAVLLLGVLSQRQDERQQDESGQGQREA